MPGRVFNTLRRVDLGRISKTTQINDALKPYSRNYNIGPRSYLPCIVHASYAPKDDSKILSKEEDQKKKTIPHSQPSNPPNQAEISSEFNHFTKAKQAEEIKLGIQTQSTSKEEAKIWSKITLNPCRKVEVFNWEWPMTGFSLINARGEEIADKPFYKKYAKNRCVIVV